MPETNSSGTLDESNAPFAPTGYGMQTGLFAPRLAKHYDVAISCFYGLEGSRLVWNGIPLFPGIGQDFGNVFLLQHAKAHFGEVKNGIVITLQDVWPLSTQMVSRLNLAAWTPVDHEPPIPGVINFFRESGAVPIAMSRFGEEQLRDAGLDPLYVPHGVDTNVYKPHDRDKVRQEVGAPTDAFLIGMVAANKGAPSRKGFQQALEAFRVFREKHNEALLYLHTVPDAGYAGGEDILTLARALGVEQHIVVAPSYKMMYDPLPPASMSQVYSALDVLLNPSQGEGFGVPVLEAASCGVSSVVTNFTAMPEVAGPTGWCVGCRPYWTPGKSWMAIADVPEIVEALEQCYGQSDEERTVRAATARSHAMQYDVEKVMEDHFLPTLEAVQERFGEKKSSVSRTQLANRAQRRAAARA